MEVPELQIVGTKLVSGESYEGHYRAQLHYRTATGMRLQTLGQS